MIAISACLAGLPCRYDGKSKPNAACQAVLLAEGALLVCPECMGGLPTPRPPAELSLGSAQDVWEGKALSLIHIFPKVQNSGDLMTDAPNVVDAAQLDDLGIMIAPGSDK